MSLFCLAGFPRGGFPLFRTAHTVNMTTAAMESQNNMAKAVETARYSFLGKSKIIITERSSTAAEQITHLHRRKESDKI